MKTYPTTGMSINCDLTLKKNRLYHLQPWLYLDKGGFNESSFGR